MSIKNSIGWTNMTLNPIRGLCPNDCKLPDGRSYCYYSGQRGIARRFKQDPELRLDLSVFDKLPKEPKKVFLVSTNDYWGDWVPDEWRQAIREKTQEYPQHTFQVLTKQYWNLPLYSPYPENWWVGASATNFTEMCCAVDYFTSVQAKVKFISFEPLLSEMLLGLELPLIRMNIGWVIIGKLTGFGHKYDPKISWVEEIVRACDKIKLPIFMKDNLKPLLGDNLRQELPNEEN